MSTSRPTLYRLPAFATLPLFIPSPRPKPPWSSCSGPQPFPLLHLSSSYRVNTAGFSPAGGEAMGRRKFRLSDMIPNAWFYKLRDMRARGRGPGAMHHQPSSSSSSSGVNRAVHQPGAPRNVPSALPRRASYYYTTRDRELPPPPPPPPPLPKATDAQFFPLPESPPRNSRRRHRVGPVRLGHAPEASGIVSAPVSARGQEPVVDAPGTSHRRRDTCIEYDFGEFQRPTATVAADDGLHGKVIASEKDIIIDLSANNTPERVLRPIVTRPVRRQLDPYELDDRHVDLAAVATRASSASEKSCTGKPRRSSVSSSGRRLRTRVNSPRLAATARKGKQPTRPSPAPALVDSFAVVKSSEDPRRDFLESMEEMIAEKGIRGAADMEDLVACYLSLNAAEYHDLIIEVFEQIWTSLASVRP